MKKFNKKQIVIFIVILISLGLIYYNFIYNKISIEQSSNINELVSNTEENKIVKEDKEKSIKVYVSGEVQNKGVYDLPENSRIADAIDKAGGVTEQANIDKINLAYILEDGMKIYIPNKSEDTTVVDDTSIYVSADIGDNSQQSSNTNSNSKTISKKININTATQTELEQLPGIGSATALKICDYRKENGKFASIEDIKKVSGIGESKFSKIKDLITI